jgi:hypothetical protein
MRPAILECKPQLLRDILTKKFCKQNYLKISSANFDKSTYSYPIKSRLNKVTCISMLELTHDKQDPNAVENLKIISKIINLVSTVRHLSITCPTDHKSYVSIAGCLKKAASLKKIGDVSIAINKNECLSGTRLANLMQLLSLTKHEGTILKMLPNVGLGKFPRGKFSEIMIGGFNIKRVQIKLPPTFDDPESVNGLIERVGGYPKLEKLILECSGTDMNDMLFAWLQHSLSFQRKLKVLNLELTGPKVTALRLSNLLDEIEQLPLTDFQICFYNFVNLIDEVMKKMIAALSRMDTLKSICLNLDKCSVGDNSISQFKALLAELRNLEKFSLRVGFTIGTISNKSVLAIAQGVRFSESLQHFGLEFEKKSGITDDGLISLAESLREISRIRSLKLSFPGCIQLTSRSIAVLGQSLSMMRMLETLILNIEANPEVDDDGLNPMITYLRRIKGLETLRVHLSLSSFSVKVIEELRKYISALPSGEVILNT